MKKADLQNEIERTLSAFDDMERAQVGDDFEQSLNQKVSFLTISSSIKWMAFSAAAMVVLLLMNIAMYRSVSNQNPIIEYSNAELLADDILYQPFAYQVYDYE